MKIIIDARSLRLYPVGQPGFTGGTEQYVRELAHGLAANHTVHVVTPDLVVEEQRGEQEWWWPAGNHPNAADAVVMVHSLEFVADYAADYLIFATNGVDPHLGPDHAFASAVDAFPVFSEKHAELLCQFRPAVQPEQCFITGLGVHLQNYDRDMPPVFGRMLYANDPARGLWHVLDIYDRLKPLVPDATLHIAYDFDKQFEFHRWGSNTVAEVLWECRERLDGTPGVLSLGALSQPDLIREQLECHVHAMPSDPPNIGSQIHGMFQMELAAASVPMVLAEIEAFPEVFRDGALFLPLPGTYVPAHERRIDAQDWAESVAALMNDSEKCAEWGRKARAIAEQNTWGHMIARWEGMLEALGAG